MSEPKSGSGTPADYLRACAEMVQSLTNFVAYHCPKAGHRNDGLHLADADAEPGILIARDDAVKAACGAVERISNRM